MQSGSVKLKPILCAGFVSLAVISIPSGSLAVTVEQVSNPRQVNGGWVTDMAGVLSPSTQAQLNQMISQLEAKNGSEIAVVTVPETAPSATPKQFATSLFNYWHIGKKGKDNGVLLLISKGNRRVEIETGYGVEPILPDAKVANIIQQQITPRFKQGDFDGGTLAGTKALVVALETNKPYSTSSADAPSSKTTVSSSTSSTDASSSDGGVPSLVYWLGGGGILAVGAIASMQSRPRPRRQVYIEPKGHSRIHYGYYGLREGLHCANCKQPMEKLNSTSLLPHLSKHEQVAQDIGSVEFESWQCPNCRQSLSEPAFHIRAYVSNSNRFSTCPTCQELTMTRKEKILQNATQYKQGRRLITYECHCCSYHREKDEIIPRLPPPRPPSPPSSSGGGSSDGGFSGGGDSFGGGSSDGGGAGGSW